MAELASAMMKATAAKCRAVFADSDIEKACPELRKLLDLAACDLESAATIIHHNIEAQWRPIETAPDDGTRVILSWGGQAVTGYYLDNSKTSHPWQGWKVPSMEKHPSGRPDRWMPFPNP